MNDYLDNVVIIGAGLGGCALALAFATHDIKFRIFESRSRDSELLKSGIIITPNGLSVLDKLGVFDRIKDRCYKATHRVFKNDKDETTKKALVANESLYGYCNHRIWRMLLLDEMKQMLNERGIEINYDSKFGGILSDGPEGATFKINDETHHASLLVGSDGIFSAVRKYLAPDIVPEYTGTLGVIAHVKWKSVAWPYEDYERNATIQGKPGAIFFLPEDPNIEDIMIGTQAKYEDSQENLWKMQTDYDRLLEFYTKGYDEHGPTAQSIIDQIRKNKETLYIWPYLKMPELPQWYSKSGRVLIMGDGAHALPPSSGQGVNQALEDSYSLTLLLSSLRQLEKSVNGENTGDEARISEVLQFWQHMRQKRIDAIFDWVNNYQNVERLPEEERKKMQKSSENQKGDDMSWLYKLTLENEINEWLDSRT